jgi:hypothetical protein
MFVQLFPCVLGILFQVQSNPMNTVKIEFASRSFVIEEAMLVLYNIPAAGLASIIGIDALFEAPVTGTAPPELEGLFSSQMVRDGTTEIAIDRPGEIRGILDAKVRRHDGSLFAAGLEFNHEITPAELRSGLAVIDINAYKELVIRVRDTAQRPLANSIVSLIRWELEGSLELHVNEDGEITMLLPPGRYGTRAPGGPPVQFEVTDHDPDQRRIELEAPVTR